MRKLSKTMKFNLPISVFLAGTILAAPVHFCCQTKSDKKAKAKNIDAGMDEGSQSEKAMSYFVLGVGKQGAEKYEAAIGLYENALKEDPEFTEALDNMGVCYRNLGNFEKAKECYKESIALFPNGPTAHQNLGLIYGIEKRYEEAIAEYEVMQKLVPDEPEGYYGTIQLYIEMREFKAAIKSATKTLELYEAVKSPLTSEAQYLLGVSYYCAGDKENAKIYLELAQEGGIDIPAVLKQDLKIK
jgi:tetratricopeptide (TPR) repeat protein